MDRYWYDLPSEEIAQIRDLAVSPVKTRLHRARALLAKSVDGGTAALQPSAAARNRLAMIPDVYDGFA